MNLKRTLMNHQHQRVKDLGLPRKRKQVRRKRVQRVLVIKLFGCCWEGRPSNSPKKKLASLSFRQQVINGLLQGFEERRIRTRHRSARPLPMSRNIPENQHFLRKHEGNSKPNCVVCSVLPSQCKKKGKGLCKRKQTSYFCAVCPERTSMCIVPCFENFHGNRVYKTVCQCIWIGIISWFIWFLGSILLFFNDKEVYFFIFLQSFWFFQSFWKYHFFFNFCHFFPHLDNLRG